MIREDRTVTLRMLADAVHINMSTCHQILREDLGKRKLNARLVPHALTQDQKEVWASICADLLQEAQNDATFVNSIIAEDESWCFQYDLQTKRQSAEWRSTGTPPSKKVRWQPSTTKTMIIVFFDARGIVHHEFVRQGQTVNEEVYISVLWRMHEALRSPDLWASGQWTLLHDNARPHTALSVSRFLTKHNVTVLPHPPCSPDRSPCDLFFSVSTTAKKAKRMATWEYRGYSSSCDDGARRHSERGIHQLLSGIQKRWQVYWLRRELLRRGQEALVTDSVSELYGQRMYKSTDKSPETY